MANLDAGTAPTGQDGGGEGGAAPDTTAPATGTAAAPATDTTPKSGEGARAAPATAADGAAVPPAAAPVPQTWPEQWRQLLAGEDKKEIERLARHKDPASIWKSHRALEQELSSGKYKRVLPTHYSAEELAEYRKSNGIPDDPKGYDTQIGDGVVWGEHDKEHIENFTSWAHEHNWTPKEVKEGLGWWHQYQEHLVGQQDEIDSANAQAAGVDFVSTWGGKTKANLNFIMNKMEGEAGLYANVMNARGPDGKRLGDNPTFVKFILEKLVAGDPTSYALPGGSSDPVKSIGDEMNSIKAKMGDKNSDYWKGPNSQAMQARYRELIDIEQRIAAKSR